MHSQCAIADKSGKSAILSHTSYFGLFSGTPIHDLKTNEDIIWSTHKNDTFATLLFNHTDMDHLL